MAFSAFPPRVGRGVWGGGQGPQVPGPPSTSQLLLLAAVHGDPAGFGRAWRFFEMVRPEIITVEISPFSVRYRQRAGRGWQRRLAAALEGLPPESLGHLAVARLAAQTALPFEYRAARDWGRAHQAPVKLLDSGSVARRHLPRYATELLTPDNLRCLDNPGDSCTLDEFIAREFRRARLARDGRLKRPPRPADEETRRRRRLWARRLRRLAAGGRRIVHLGGWEHLVPWADDGGLAELLQDLRPRVVLLDEADQL